ncbi:MAG: glutamyl-tRNA reductase [Desulfobacterales bacterium]|nr:glutamyl-tRNA reductase [Desulfobacterales bacterium]
MSEIVLTGLNHKTAPVQIRERIAFSKEEAMLALEDIIKIPHIDEALLLSTCNRVELLITTKTPDSSMEILKNYISKTKNLAICEFENCLYTYTGSEAIRHIFKVASSLDSLIVGEPQILGQIKEAYRIATQKKTSNVILNKLMHKTFSVAKKVRTETGICDNAVSISYAAVELAKKIFGELDDKKILLIGAGEMAELAVEHLLKNKVTEILVANRTFKKGLELAEKFNGKAIMMEEIAEVLKIVDIIISSTGSPDFILKTELIKKIMKERKNRHLFFIDIAVPRDIHPDINRLPNCYVYDIDDLQGIIDDNIEERNKEALKGERIINESVIRFEEWMSSLKAVPTIVALRAKIDNLAKSEAEKNLLSLKSLSKNDYESIMRMTESIVNKILHYPTVYLKNNGCAGNNSQYIDMIKKIFKLDET